MLRTALALSLYLLGASVLAQSCPPQEGKSLLWGDLHVHTIYSLDAYAFGAVATPQDAYAFARGQPLRLANGEEQQIDRPLDFVAVTDHAETFDQMYLCTDPEFRDNGYCQGLRTARDAKDARRLFNDNLLPVVAGQPPQQPEVCHGQSAGCALAAQRQWRRIQEAANQANTPCEFTALIGYEWTASPGGRHWHRNVIYASDKVPSEAFDYVRFPTVDALWKQLDQHCRPEQGCNVLTIPHNLNWTDGGPTFAAETEAPEITALRTRYERLAEMHQEKGNSECLPQDPASTACKFERVRENSARSRLSPPPASPEAGWRAARSGYYRTLLGRGLKATANGSNPYMLGAVGSTDTHLGLPGWVQEASYRPLTALFLTDEQTLKNTAYNPGGLVAVWADENTRAGVFEALARRETYATSGPRIKLRFGASNVDVCKQGNPQAQVNMGGTIGDAMTQPWFSVQAARDAQKIARVEVVKASYWAGALTEQVVELAIYKNGVDTVCLSWQDPGYNPAAPAFYYARVLEQPSPRWSKLMCEAGDLCDKYPQADQMIQERAWSSPIWRLPSN